MNTWQATIKEKGNEHILTPIYMVNNMFNHIADEKQREYETRKFLVNFWGLNNPDVEWFKLEKID